MDIQSRPYTGLSEQSLVSEFLQKVYIWMCGGLVLTGIISWHVANSRNLLESLVMNRNMFMGLIIAELALVMIMSFMANRVSAFVAGTMFVAYSALNGITLSVIFLAYTLTSVAQVFFLTAGMFAGMSIYGFVTKKDLTSWGSFLFMALLGMILAMLVNFFFKSSTLSLIISFAGVIIFTGLTAYDTQKLKQIALSNPGISSNEKPAIYGALTLYLDFINLFLSLLNILGKRR